MAKRRIIRLDETPLDLSAQQQLTIVVNEVKLELSKELKYRTVFDAARKKDYLESERMKKTADYKKMEVAERVMAVFEKLGLLGGGNER